MGRLLGGWGRESFARYLAGLDEQALVRRCCGCAETSARRRCPPTSASSRGSLTTSASLSSALERLSLDVVTLGSCVAALGPSATVPALVELLAAPEQRVRAVLGVLFERGLAWESGGAIRLPGTLARNWTLELGGPTGSAAAAQPMPELRSLVVRIDALPGRLRDALCTVRRPFDHFGAEQDPDGSLTSSLLAEGLVTLNDYGHPRLSRQVQAAMWVAEHRLELAPAPVLPPAPIDAATANSAAQAAAEQLLRWLSALLDRARDEPVVALRKGGIGVRERARLSAALSIPDQPLTLCLDLAYVTGLLGHSGGRYAPSEAYKGWRAAPAGRQWAVLADAWLDIEYAPTHRYFEDGVGCGVGGGTGSQPPLPGQPYGRWMRRVLLTAATEGGMAGEYGRRGGRRGGGPARSVRRSAACTGLGRGFSEQQRVALIAAIIREAEWRSGWSRSDQGHRAGVKHLLAWPGWTRRWPTRCPRLPRPPHGSSCRSRRAR